MNEIDYKTLKYIQNYKSASIQGIANALGYPEPIVGRTINSLAKKKYFRQENHSAWVTNEGERAMRSYLNPKNGMLIFDLIYRARQWIKSHLTASTIMCAAILYILDRIFGVIENLILSQFLK